MFSISMANIFGLNMCYESKSCFPGQDDPDRSIVCIY